MKLFKKAHIIFGAVLLAFVAVTPIVKSQNQNVNQGGNGLQISPTRTEISTVPGDKKSGSFIVKNITSGELTAQVEINDFESDGVTGNPRILTDTSNRLPTTIANFVKGLGNFDLKPGESKKVDFTVEIPENAAPGAYYGVVRYAAVPRGGVLTDRDRQLALTASIGHLVLVEVAGDITEQIQLEKLKAQRDGNTAWIFTKVPNESALTVKNLGNGFSRPFGNVTVKNILGKEVFRYDVNNAEPKGIVLPSSTRIFVDKLEGVKLPGRYSMTAAVAYGNGGEVVTFKSSFWYLPVWLIIALAVLLAVAGFYGRRYYVTRFGSATKKRRKSNKK